MADEPAAPAAVVVVVDEPVPDREPLALVVEVELEPPPLPLAGGSLYAPSEVPDAEVVEAFPTLPLIHIPMKTATNTARKSCQVFQARLPLMCNCPGSGRVSSGPAPAAGAASFAWSTEFVSGDTHPA